MDNKTREIVLDTETTGLNAKNGDRVIEIGCVELIGHIPSGKTFQTYLNPESKQVSKDAIKIHNIDNEFLKTQPVFKNKANEFINFLSNDILVIHNSKFDLEFLNNELKLCQMKPINNLIVDTLVLAKRKIGTGQANLDSLCKRYNISLDQRKVHGALLDATLLAEVYIELLGGRQADLNFLTGNQTKDKNNAINKKNKETKKIIVKNEDINAHKNFVKSIKNALWSKHSY